MAFRMIDRRTALKVLAAGGIGLWALPATSQSKSAALDNSLEKAVAAGHAPGLVGLVARGRDVHVGSIGRAAIDGATMQRDSISLAC